MKISVKPQYSKTKEDIWNDVFENLVEEEKILAGKKGISRFLPVIYVAASVLFVLLLSARFYITDVSTVMAQNQKVILPDKSEVILNADSKISYRPFWWLFSRQVHLTGEAFFSVTKGKKFCVETALGNVQVLGTEFNVYVRDKRFETFCRSGRVKVISGNDDVILLPHQQSRLTQSGFELANLPSFQQPSSWIQGQFNFDKRPLPEVIREIERQYNIKVSIPANCNYIYSGNFSRKKSPAEVLHIVGAPFGLELTYSKR